MKREKIREKTLSIRRQLEELELYVHVILRVSDSWSDRTFLPATIHPLFHQQYLKPQDKEASYIQGVDP